ncbi:MAG: PSD1 domain-containing protein [Planctomycetes bacterium]|nr:PSD1 domain-containing protein [Planctomycetota bacterium]
MASVFALGILATTALGADRIRFNEQIRPLLSDRCFACHGPDGKRREADLRLDLRDHAVGDADGPLAIVPGSPDKSPLWERITSTDPDLQMPPASAKKPKFTPAELALIRRWIEEGAEYEGHWAFLPLKSTVPPSVALPTRNPIDAFVRAKLVAIGLAPSPPADRATLLRRVTLDLTGLLPSPEEVLAFVQDPHEDAYERVVDRLLASPQYGERWGRHWLDQARYADSSGYAIDAPRDMWPYRDWVIDALNRDLPFDQFTIEQLAGDLLPNATKSQVMATAFHRNTLINQEGGSDREQFRVEATMDRVNTTGAVWLGLTVGCAQCHTHKFDPITQREYYELLAFFNSAQDANDRGPAIEVRRGEVFGNPEVFPAEPTPLPKEELARLRAAWEQTTRERLAAVATTPVMTVWSPVKYGTLQTESKSGGFQRQDDNSLLYDRRGSGNERFLIELSTELPTVAAVRLRLLTHDDLPKGGPGTAGNGNFVLTDFTIRVSDQKQMIARAFADHEQPGFPIPSAIDGDATTGWAINVGPGSTARMNANHEATFVLAKPLLLNGRSMTVELAHGLNKNYLIGRFALDVTSTVPDERKPDDQALLAALQKPDAQRTKEELAALQAAFEKAEPRARPVKKEPNPHIAQLMVMRDQPEPRETYIFTRGDFTRPDKDAGKLSAGVLSAVAPALPDATSPRTRLDLARWLVHPDNPLTPRVTVNRIWMRYFGRGLVETEEDFGTQGTPPSHHELLDWLSREFQRQGWSQKRLHRLIVLSETYQQSSRERPELTERDPRNLLLARQQRLRLEAEITRDAALSASGLLNVVLGGPSVFPPQPDGVYAFTQVNKSWPTETGPQRFRRTLYTFYYRSAPYPLFTTFDAPDFQATCTRRLRSNTPLQALTMANDVVFLELAQGLALRLAIECPDGLDRRIARAVMLCFGRPATKVETQVLNDYVTAQVADFTKDPSAAEKLLTPALRAKLPAAEAASLVLLARTLFNADNFITRE